MNKFLGKKKTAPEAVKTNLDAFNALNNTSPQPSPPLKKSTSRWKKSKKPVEERPELDFNLALPSQDDFRTSLLMPNLSARFSMLREQDDPSSKLGKASDDSVLQPRRKSRMLDYGFAGSGLNDIAEVQSIHSSIRPPFANERQFSYNGSEEGYASESDPSGQGSVMGRARPGEGNIMFGGRQKIYKISGNGSSRGLGKAVYEDDINLSAFQRYRQRERERQEQERPSEDSTYDSSFYDDANFDHPSDSAKDLSHSLSFSSQQKRSTVSSTARSEARSSTAATSIHSQPYAPGSSPHVAAVQPASAVPNNLNPLKRQDTKGRRLYEPGLDQHIQDQQNSAMARFNSVQRKRTGTNGTKPPPNFLHTARSMGNLNERGPGNVYAVGEQNLPTLRTRKTDSPSLSSAPHSPVSPVAMNFEADDTLVQALEPGDRGKATAMGAFNKPNHQFDALQYLERQQILQKSQSRAGRNEPGQATAQQQRLGRFEQDRERSGSNASGRSRSRSISRSRVSNDSVKPYNLFHNAAARAGAPQIDRTVLPDTHRTFFGNISASESDDEDDASREQPTAQSNRWHPTTLPSVSEHPALRSRKSRSSLNEERDSPETSALRSAPSLKSLRTQDHPLNFAAGTDSPTLGANVPRSHRLNSMVHHLRQGSDQSSIYPSDELSDPTAPPVPAVPQVGSKNLELVNCRARTNVDAGSRLGSTHTHSNPWDLDEVDTFPASHGSGSLADNARTSDARVSEHLPWQEELRKQPHHRDVSSATQQERDAFATELAARRNAIQENMKSIVERDAPSSRGGSPHPSSTGNFKTLGMLKTKSSRESVAAPSKAKQLLGMGERSGSSFDGSQSREPSVPRATETSSKLRQQSRPRDDSDPTRRQTASGRASAGARDQRSRSRSNSAATSGRSRSRTPRYNDEQYKTMVDSLGGQSDVPARLPFSPAMSPEIAQSPSWDEPARETTSNRSAMTSYFESKSSQGSRVSPANYSSAVTSSIGMVRQGPTGIPFGQTMTPPMSGSSTPNTGTTSSPVTAAPSGVSATQYRSMPRKKTISKSDISEPHLVSSTSNVDTVELPEGASLKNGMGEAPPLPPINPKRRLKIFGRGRSDDNEDAQSPDSAITPDSATPRSPDNGRFDMTRKSRSNTATDRSNITMNPAIPGAGVGSPERKRSAQATSGAAMF